MLAIKTFLASAVLAASLPAVAAPIFLNFEDNVLNQSPVGNFYQSLGVEFSPSAINLRRSEPGVVNGANFRRYSDLASKSAVGMYKNGGGLTEMFINVSSGFTGMFSMLYTADASANEGGFVELFTGTSGAGTAIKVSTQDDPLNPDGTLPRLGLFTQAACRDPSGTLVVGVVCTWAEVKLNFTDVARSVHISGISGAYFFDNMAFGDAADPIPPSKVPEPGSVALSLVALGALALTRKRLQRWISDAQRVGSRSFAAG